MLILVYRDEKFVVARREIAPGTTEPYTGPIEKGFLLHHYRQNLNFADVDGDGITELIQSLVFDPEELAGLGYGNPASTGNERYEVCRLLKWNAEQERIVQLEERLVVREAT